MAYNSQKTFLKVERRLSADPGLKLRELALQLGCSHPRIETIVFKHTNLTFRDNRKTLLLEAGISYLKQGYRPREVTRAARFTL